MQIIDPHLHLFNLHLGAYSWLREENPPSWPDKSRIYRDFSESNLSLVAGLRLGGYVHVEAGFDNQASWREVDWLEQEASLPLRSVGHLDIRLPTAKFIEGLKRLTQRESIVGVRHIFDDAASELIHHPNTYTNLAQLAANNLHFELQFNTQIASDCATVEGLIEALPQLQFILNHAGFCPLDHSGGASETSLAGLRNLSKHSNLTVKSSGFEMLNRAFEPANAAQLTACLCKLFGETRVMLASNFPLITLSMSYSDYWAQMIEALQAENLPVERLIYENAKRIYRFD